MQDPLSCLPDLSCPNVAGLIINFPKTAWPMSVTQSCQHVLLSSIIETFTRYSSCRTPSAACPTFLAPRLQISSSTFESLLGPRQSHKAVSTCCSALSLRRSHGTHHAGPPQLPARPFLPQRCKSHHQLSKDCLPNVSHTKLSARAAPLYHEDVHTLPIMKDILSCHSFHNVAGLIIKFPKTAWPTSVTQSCQHMLLSSIIETFTRYSSCLPDLSCHNTAGLIINFPKTACPTSVTQSCQHVLLSSIIETFTRYSSCRAPSAACPTFLAPTLQVSSSTFQRLLGPRQSHKAVSTCCSALSLRRSHCTHHAGPPQLPARPFLPQRCKSHHQLSKDCLPNVSHTKLAARAAQLYH